MKILLFTRPSNFRILEKQKFMTARNWSDNYPRPKVGEDVRAQTGRKKITTFALLEITNVWEWDGNIWPTFKCDDRNLPFGKGEVTLELLQKIGIAEGFGDAESPWDDFIHAYYSLNKDKFLDEDRRHWFIQFQAKCGIHFTGRKFEDVYDERCQVDLDTKAKG